MDVQKLLKTLQSDVRAERELTTHFGRSGKIPARLATPEAGFLNVGSGISQMIREVVATLLTDERFEHLADEADAAVWEFVCDCAINRSTDHVKAFMKANGRSLTSYVMQFGIDYLGVAELQVVGDVEFLALPGEDTDDGRHFRRDAAAGCIAQVTVTGTDPQRAVERGRERVRHALGVLRVSLANVHMLHKKQLRFRLGEMYISGGQGFHRREDAAYSITFEKSITDTFPNFELLPIPLPGDTEIQRRLALAVSWIDAAHMDTSPIHRVGFLFTALEAMLGDTSEGLKAPALVFYRTALGHAVKGSFPDPNRLYFLYDQVRSFATHGEAVPEVTDDDVTYLNWNIRETMFELVSFCASRNLSKRSQVRRELLKDGADQLALDFLRSNGPEEWWGNWSPGPKPAKAQRENQLAAEVEVLKTEVDGLKRQLAELRQPVESAPDATSG